MTLINVSGRNEAITSISVIRIIRIELVLCFLKT